MIAGEPKIEKAGSDKRQRVLPVMTIARVADDSHNRLFFDSIPHYSDGLCVAELAVVSNADLHGGHLFALGHASKDLAREVGQEGIGEDVVDVASAAFNLGAAVGYFVEEGVVVAEF